MKNILLLSLFLFNLVMIDNAKAMSFQINTELSQLVNQAFYREISPDSFYEKIIELGKVQNLSTDDLNYLGDAVLKLYNLDIKFSKSHSAFACFAPQSENYETCDKKNLFKSTYNLTEEIEKPQPMKLSSNLNKEINQKNLFWESTTGKVILYSSAFLGGYFISDFFQKNEVQFVSP